MRFSIESLLIDPAAKSAALDGLEEVRDRYDGVLASHNSSHTLDVCKGTYLISRLAGLGMREIGLGIIAAGNHDREHSLDGYGANEAASAERAVKSMEKHGIFTFKERQRVHDMVMGTRTKIVDGDIVQEAASSSSIFDRSLADGDLGTLGMPTPDNLDRTEALFREYHPDESFESEAYYKFLELEVSIHRTHEYLTPWASQVFPHMRKNAAYYQAVLDSAQSRKGVETRN